MGLLIACMVILAGGVATTLVALVLGLRGQRHRHDALAARLDALADEVRRLRAELESHYAAPPAEPRPRPPSIRT
ncbi:MAG: hypothetical protein IMZ55_17595 [Acidobacteria bacterium]|nr:hypothetical protein [Planctomycetota bacterium]MBE3135283.1 hypothetical protein [Acidobacteriota bacterium]